MQTLSLAMKNALGKVFMGTAVLFCRGLHGDPEPVLVTIFIHGTVGSAIEMAKKPSMLFTKQDCANEKNPDQEKYRALRLHEEEQLIGPCELIKLQPEIIADYQTNDSHSKYISPYAQYHVVAAYDAMLKRTYEEIANRDYYLFGWSGRFSEAARYCAAEDFNTALRKLRDQYYQKGLYPVFNVEAHSHGGTVAVLCAEIAAQQEDPVLINYAAIYGMPVSSEIKKGLESPALRAVYQFYSPHDQIQTVDKFSTPDGKSTACIQDALAESTINEMLIRVDVSVQGDPKAPVDHVNMWKVGRSHAFAPPIDPLPFFVMSPIIVRHLGALKPTKTASVKLEHKKDNFSLKVQAEGNSVELASEIERAIMPLTERIKKRWQPTDKSRSIFFNKQLLAGVKIMFGIG